MIKQGMIVRYSSTWWCSPKEQKYLYVVIENLQNPRTNEWSRWLIKRINTKKEQVAEVVEDYMICPTGLTISDFERGERR